MKRIVTKIEQIKTEEVVSECDRCGAPLPTVESRVGIVDLRVNLRRGGVRPVDMVDPTNFEFCGACVDTVGKAVAAVATHRQSAPPPVSA